MSYADALRCLEPYVGIHVSYPPRHRTRPYGISPPSKTEGCESVKPNGNALWDDPGLR